MSAVTNIPYKPTVPSYDERAQLIKSQISKLEEEREKTTQFYNRCGWGWGIGTVCSINPALFINPLLFIGTGISLAATVFFEVKKYSVAADYDWDIKVAQLKAKKMDV
jgi:hypothetical protein